jgi:hypothetical protein
VAGIVILRAIQISAMIKPEISIKLIAMYIRPYIDRV